MYGVSEEILVVNDVTVDTGHQRDDDVCVFYSSLASTAGYVYFRNKEVTLMYN